MTCAVCRRDEKAVNTDARECAHVDCPHRRPVTAAMPARAQSTGAGPAGGQWGPWVVMFDRSDQAA